MNQPLIVSYNTHNRRPSEEDITKIADGILEQVARQHIDTAYFAMQECPDGKETSQRIVSKINKALKENPLSLSQQNSFKTRTQAHQWVGGQAGEMGTWVFSNRRATANNLFTTKDTSNSNKGVCSIVQSYDKGRFHFAGLHLESHHEYRRINTLSDWFENYFAPSYLSFDQITDRATDDVFVSGDINTRLKRNTTSLADDSLTDRAMKTMGFKKSLHNGQATYPNEQNKVGVNYLDDDPKRHDERKGGNLSPVWSLTGEQQQVVVQNTTSSDHKPVFSIPQTQLADTNFDRTKEFIAGIISNIASDEVIDQVRHCTEAHQDYLQDVYFYYCSLIKLQLLSLSFESRQETELCDIFNTLITGEPGEQTDAKPHNNFKTHCDHFFALGPDRYRETPQRFAFYNKMHACVANTIATHQSTFNSQRHCATQIGDVLLTILKVITFPISIPLCLCFNAGLTSKTRTQTKMDQSLSLLKTKATESATNDAQFSPSFFKAPHAIEKDRTDKPNPFSSPTKIAS